MKKYKASVVEDDGQLRTFWVEYLQDFDFDADGYREAEQLLHAIQGRTPQELPDLIMVDLELVPGKMQGMELVSQLVVRDVPSVIVAVSGREPGSKLSEVIMRGAADWLTKPPDWLKVKEQVAEWAEVGMRRRLNRPDSARGHRSVFLSFSGRDQERAHGLRRHMEAKHISVWYSNTSLEPGDTWRRELERAINEANVFVPLITDNYVVSPHCMSELARFWGRIDVDEPRLLLVPVLGEPSEKAKNDETIRRVVGRYQYLDFSDPSRFVDRLGLLLGRIQKVLDLPATERSAQSIRVARRPALQLPD
jgi:DNA-binding response OmpR family regulator